MKNKALTNKERYSIRLGYMGTGMLIIAPYLVETSIGQWLYIIAGVLLTPQVVVAKQWNLVVLNMNMIIAYGLLLNK